MSTIHLDIDRIKGVLALMIKDETEIREIIKWLTNSITGIHGGDWEGKAESDFFKEYEELDAQLNKQIDSMEMLAERLRQEIAEWEAMIAKLNQGTR